MKVAQSRPNIESKEFSRPEYWSGKPIPSLGDIPNPGMKPRSPSLQADSLIAEPQGRPTVVWKQNTIILRNAYKIYSISDDQQELERQIENARGRCRGLSSTVRYMGIRFLGIWHDLEIQSYYINFHARDTVHVILVVSSHADETICVRDQRERSEIFQFCFFSLLSLVEQEWRRKQNRLYLSWEQDSILGRTVDFELYAQYLWKWHTNWETRPPKEEPQGSPSPKKIP